MGATSVRRVRRAGRKLLAAGLVLLLLAAFIRPTPPPGAGPDGVSLAASSQADYTLIPFAPDQPIAVEAQGGALVKRIDGGDGVGAFAFAPQAWASPLAHFEPIGRAPDERPPPRIAVSRSLTTGPPRLDA